MTTTSSSVHPHAEFLALIPAVERHARFAFRGRPATDQDDVAAEAVAAAYTGYVQLIASGKNPLRDFPSALISFAVLHARAGRHIASANSTTDVLSPLAQRKRGFRVESLPTSSGVARDHLNSTVDRRRTNEFDEWLHDNTKSPVPDQAAFRVDFPTFLAGLGNRDRALARFLALGHAAHVAADRFGLTEGRVSQLRKTWRDRWCLSQGEPVEGRPHVLDDGRERVGARD